MKCSSETLQNLPYFFGIQKATFLFLCYFIFPLMNALVYVEVAQNEKREKLLGVFLFQ